MNPKTEDIENSEKGQRRSFTNKFLLQICILTFLALAAMVLVERVALSRLQRYSRVQIDMPLALPWISAADATMYSLAREASAPRAVGLYILSGVLVVFILCPTVFLFGWRKRRLEQPSSIPPEDRPIGTSSLAYVFSGIVTCFIALAVVPLAVVTDVSQKSRCESETARMLRYNVSNEIDFIAANAFQFRLLPKNLGGGEGTYAGYKIPEKLARTDFAEYTATAKPDTLELRAESATCASNVITLILDRHGTTSQWSYQGNWGAG